ncbi:MAG: DUF1631 family protein [Pseudomonadales bacterium]
MSEGLQQTFTAIQRQATSEVLHLLDGFYENLEHGLFELAFRIDQSDIQARCAALMKDLRLRKGMALRSFTTLMEADVALWTSVEEAEEFAALQTRARSLARKYENHFATVLGSMAGWIALATNRADTETEVPIGPNRLAYHFLRSISSAHEDRELSSMLCDLFGRLVLDRLGPLYGRSNARLEKSFSLLALPDAETA